MIGNKKASMNQDFFMIGVIVIVVIFFIFWIKGKSEKKDIINVKNISGQKITLDKKIKKKISKTQGPLVLAMSADLMFYRSEQYLRLNWKLTNISEKDILINKNIVEGKNLLFELTDPEGAKLYFPKRRRISREQELLLVKDVVSVSPGEFIGESVRVYRENFPLDYVSGYYSMRAYLTLYKNLLKNDKPQVKEKLTSDPHRLYIPDSES